MNILNVTNLKWANEEHSLIDCEIHLNTGEVWPFTAASDDSTEHGKRIYELALSGELGVIAPYPPPPAPPPSPVLTRIYKADIWRRSTDAEAVTIAAAIKTRSERLQGIWNDSLWISTADDLYPVIRAAFVQAFGEIRALELLLPTE